jgi:abortive infection bacteriophage resistance protein
VREVKEFKSYGEQLAILEGRGMAIENREEAIESLAKVNYYRLSGYWHALRQAERDASGETTPVDQFREGVRFDDVVALYEYDRRLRSIALPHLSQPEVYLRASLGYLLGEIDPLIHEKENLLDVAPARREIWNKFVRICGDSLQRSKEDFAVHHIEQYDGKVPVWVLVEVLDLGALQNLYLVSLPNIRRDIAKALGCTDPQLETWINSLRVMRNICAHQSRFYNKLHPEPRLPRVLRGGRVESPEIREVVDLFGVPQPEENHKMRKTFGMLILLKYLMDQGGIGDTESLAQILKERPNISVPGVDVSRAMGIPQGWEETRLWS